MPCDVTVSFDTTPPNECNFRWSAADAREGSSVFPERENRLRIFSQWFILDLRVCPHPPVPFDHEDTKTTARRARIRSEVATTHGMTGWKNEGIVTRMDGRPGNLPAPFVSSCPLRVFVVKRNWRTKTNPEILVCGVSGLRG